MTIEAETAQSPRRIKALSLARERLRSAQPLAIAQRSGARYEPREKERGVFELPCLSHSFQVSYPEGLVESAGGAAPPKHALALVILHYLVHADGHRMADSWVAFRELPDGLVYHSAVQRRVEPPLLAAYGTRMDRFCAAARAAGGRPISFGDAAFMFDVLPRVRMAVILHRGDEEFPPAARVLYDGAAGHYLPTEDLAILGGMLVGALLTANPE